MRLKSLLLLIFLTQIFGVSVFGQASDKTASSKVEKKDSVQVKNARGGITPFFVKGDITPSVGRENAPVLTDKMDSRQSIFYSNAQMYVAKNEKDDGSGGVTPDASIFIQGTAKFDNVAEILQVGETALTGDFVSLKYIGNANLLGEPVPLFVKHADNQQNTVGLIKFVGKKNSQHVVRENLAGDRLPSVNVVKVGTLNESQYVIEFPKLKVEKDNLKTVTQFKAAIAAAGGYDVEKMGFVSANSNVAMSVEELDMTNGNRFSVDVVSDGLNKEAMGVAQASITTAEYYKLNSAYVDMKKIFADGADSGNSEVNLRMYDYDAAQDDAQATLPDGTLKDQDIQRTNTNPVVLEGGKTTHATFLRGFTSPFEQLRSDYMFYHVLTRPSATSITSWQGPISEPNTNIDTGYGHFMAMDASSAYFDNIEDRWHTDGASALRARGGYNWSRVAQRMKDESHPSDKFSLYTFDASDAGRTHEEQRFNVEDVVVQVVGPNQLVEGTSIKGRGLNFLGNPFMTPIDMSGLLAEYNGTNYVTAGVEGNNAELVKVFSPRFHNPKVKAVHAVTANAIATAVAGQELLLRSQYWVVHSALIANTEIGGLPAYAYNVKYDNAVAVNQAATPSYPNIFEMRLDPMQMFLVQAATSGNFVFTKAMKTFKGTSFPIVFHTAMPTVPETGARASARAAASENETQDYMPSDWLVVEAIAADKGKTSVDRTAVRFFDGATMGSDEMHDVLKNLEAPKTTPANAKALRTEEKPTAQESSTNYVYTTATGGIQLLSNGVGYDTKQIPLYYISTSDVQNVTFAITGVEGFDRVGSVTLVDRFVNGDDTEYLKEITATDNTYEFTTIPGKETVDGENRFFLRFDEDNDGEGPSVTGDPITCYYSGSTLHIGGLNEKDLGSTVQIFDLQGRLMGNTVINNYPAMEYPKPLGQGTFIVNISGERSYKTKFVNLQNY